MGGSFEDGGDVLESHDGFSEGASGVDGVFHGLAGVVEFFVLSGLEFELVSADDAFFSFFEVVFVRLAFAVRAEVVAFRDEFFFDGFVQLNHFCVVDRHDAFETTRG